MAVLNGSWQAMQPGKAELSQCRVEFTSSSAIGCGRPHFDTPAAYAEGHNPLDHPAIPLTTPPSPTPCRPPGH